MPSSCMHACMQRPHDSRPLYTCLRSLTQYDADFAELESMGAVGPWYRATLARQNYTAAVGF